ncbi:MAG: hypothetical protein P8X67_12675 [Syntrophobacterales bacterium]
MDKRPMRIFFLLRHSEYLRNYESVVRLLAARGHTVHLGFYKIGEDYKESEIRKLQQDNGKITYALYSWRDRLWTPIATPIRLLQTYLRFLDTRYHGSNKLRQRAASELPSLLCFLLRIVVGKSEKRIWSFVRFLRKIERAIPVDLAVRKILKSNNPDVFLVTPLIDLKASQLTWLKGAKFLSIKTGLCVFSWDNLTNKSLIQLETDIVLVWNEIQKREAIEFHRIAPSKVAITGAQCYDKWFDHKPSTSRKDFLRNVGLGSQSPYILYLCSSPFIAPKEVEFVERWARNLRKHKDPDLKNLGVLIRPHPRNFQQWEDVDLSHLQDVVIYPRKGANPVNEDSVNEFYDSMYHSVAAVGINTSAMIEAGILNKPVFTILAPDFNTTQEGTLHFHYLVQGGLLYISDSLDEHLDQLSKVLNGQSSYQEKIRSFIESFVRPHGLDSPSTPIFVEAVENLDKMSFTSPEYKKPWWSYPFIVFLFPFAVIRYLIMQTTRAIRKVGRQD